MGSLGMPEILLILVIALIIFGPRKLPELGKSLGQGLAHFRKASEDFKRQWEDEVEVEKRRIESPPPSAVEAHSNSEPQKEPEHPALGHPETNATPETTATGAAEASTPGHNESVARDTVRDWA